MSEFLYFLPFIGAFVGFISGFFGIGGGAILVPILLLFGMDVKSAISVAVMQMFVAAVFGSYFNYKRGKFEIGYGLYLGVGALIGGFCSAYIIQAVSENTLKIALLCAIAFSFYRLLRANVYENTQNRELKPWVLFLLGVGIAMLAVSIGMGGAIFLTPILVGILGVDIKKAVSFGLFFVIFSSFGGFVSQSVAGLIDFKIGAILSVGALVGVYFGTLAHHKIEKGKQKICLLVLNICTFSLMLKSLIWG